jgi:hypothetical protein
MGDEHAIGVNRGQSMLRRKRDDQFAVSERCRTHHHDESGIGRSRERRNGALNFVRIA